MTAAALDSTGLLPRPDVPDERCSCPRTRAESPRRRAQHPAVVALIDQGNPTGTVTPDAVRQASEDAAIEPRHLKGLLAHLSGLGISVDVRRDASAAPGAVPRPRKKAAHGAKATTASTAKKAAAPRRRRRPPRRPAPAEGAAAGQEGRSRPKKAAAKKAGRRPAPTGGRRDDARRS